ncbi:MAG: hypothetical protein ACLRMZ_24890 [Blautia marasmi]
MVKKKNLWITLCYALYGTVLYCICSAYRDGALHLILRLHNHNETGIFRVKNFQLIFGDKDFLI